MNYHAIERRSCKTNTTQLTDIVTDPFDPGFAGVAAVVCGVVAFTVEFELPFVGLLAVVDVGDGVEEGSGSAAGVTVEGVVSPTFN